MEIDKYCARNLQERERRNEAERRRQHEAQHAQQVSMQEEKDSLTAGENIVGESEPEKEIDPSLVGSLDDVYPDEPGSEMDEDVDPFKQAPVMDEHEKPSSLMAMERSLDAMAALTEHDEDPGSPPPVNDTEELPLNNDSDDVSSLDRGTRQCNSLLPDLVGVASTQQPDVADLAMGGVCSVDLLEDASHLANTEKPSQPLDLTDGLTSRTQQINS